MGPIEQSHYRPPSAQPATSSLAREGHGRCHSTVWPLCQIASKPGALPGGLASKAKPGAKRPPPHGKVDSCERTVIIEGNQMSVATFVLAQSFSVGDHS